jgi:hypothetical protein
VTYQRALDNLIGVCRFDPTVVQFASEMPVGERERALSRLELEVVDALVSVEYQVRALSRTVGSALDWVAGISGGPVMFAGFTEASAHTCLCRFAGRMLDHLVRCVSRESVITKWSPGMAEDSMQGRGTQDAPAARGRAKPRSPADLGDDDRAILAASVAGPRTQKELSQVTGLPRTRIQSRTPELQRWDLLTKVEGRHGFACTETGERWVQQLAAD